MAARATIKNISDLVPLHGNTIRNWVDEGIISAKRDFRGRRWFPEPQKTVREINALLDEKSVTGKQS